MQMTCERYLTVNGGGAARTHIVAPEANALFVLPAAASVSCGVRQL